MTMMMMMVIIIAMMVIMIAIMVMMAGPLIHNLLRAETIFVLSMVWPSQYAVPRGT